VLCVIMDFMTCVVPKDYTYDFEHLFYFPVIPYFTLFSVSSDKSGKINDIIRGLRDERNQIYLQILTLDLDRTIKTYNKTLNMYMCQMAIIIEKKERL